MHIVKHCGATNITNQCKRKPSCATEEEESVGTSDGRIKLHVYVTLRAWKMIFRGEQGASGVGEWRLVGNEIGSCSYGHSRCPTTLSVSASTVTFCRPSPVAMTTPLKCGSIGSDGGPDPGVDVGVDVVAAVESAGLKFRKGGGATSGR